MSQGPNGLPEKNCEGTAARSDLRGGLTYAKALRACSAPCRGLLDQSAECIRVEYGEVGQNLPADFDAGVSQSIHKAAVRHSVHARGRIDPHDPKRSKRTLLLSPVPIRICHPPFDGADGRAVKFAASAPVATGPFQQPFFSSVRCDTVSCPGHVISSGSLAIPRCNPSRDPLRDLGVLQYGASRLSRPTRRRIQTKTKAFFLRARGPLRVPLRNGAGASFFCSTSWRGCGWPWISPSESSRSFVSETAWPPRGGSSS